ncbi:CC0125/CC1285 family lipoprotein [Parvularcula sp. LCG005]|uniref:CC0125/CC1285 family lipoprotein n=1 Tax=Parvularcula sp. LCG005 TaxID=3078805 RepID=UPI002943BB98|nr:hypothetical protein [Parvularcula sp. LCG005]WOI53050.1 hypothetical protein RUI03_12935 [Parvularcula sp. LCG005]
MKHFLLASTLVLGLGACSVTPAYGPSLERDDFGYREQRIETNRYRVVYRAPDRGMAMDGALRRAAELTVAQGYDYFEVVSRDTDAERRGRSGPSVGIGGSTGGRNSGVGVGISLPLGGGNAEEVTARLEVLMGRGTKPDTGEAYDARVVLENLVP